METGYSIKLMDGFGIRVLFLKTGSLIPMDIGRVPMNMAGYGLLMNRGAGHRIIMVAGLGINGMDGFGYRVTPGLLRG